MIKGRKIVVVLPAYNAARTIAQTYAEIPFDVVDEVVLVDDQSHDETVKIAADLGIKHIHLHDSNRGYGANQKTCYQAALDIGADIVVMLHPDYQYDPRLIKPMCEIIASEIYPVVLGSRILGGGALRGGMPFYKYFFNRVLTFIQNLFCGAKLSEYHTGYRAFSSKVLREVNYRANSDDFIFDNEILSQILMKGLEISEVTCPARYFKEASSINFPRSVKYGLGILRVSLQHFLHKLGIVKNSRYS
jgi:glycosyltransferase involved in cell wall biosynthesis